VLEDMAVVHRAKADSNTEKRECKAVGHTGSSPWGRAVRPRGPIRLSS
jgi:hypothetical protein